MNRSVAADDQTRIQRTLARLRDATDLPLTFGGAVNSDMQLQLTQFVGAIAGALRGAVLDPGRGLGGKVVTRRRPQLVNDYVGSPGISHHYDHIIQAECLRALVAVPLVVRGRVRGVLYGAVRSATPLGDRTVHSVMEMARELEQDLAVDDELARRLRWLDERVPEPRTAAGTHEPAGTQREQLREAYAELRILAKNTEDPTLRERIEAVCHKLSTAGGDARPAAGTAVRRQTAPLSDREVDVLACVALGWTNPQVAADLGITVETVKSYLRSATRKLQARSRLEAVVAARRRGLLP
ncbi:HTH-type transcriptional activator RamA [Streptomyces sp. RB17]|uniref:helix-turn-helix transcriptional regulator n=1 Tax=Streptomyces sp. RB17 TaxID=2585197 RepID=UPI00130A2E97|nr:LuxR C-terminal-related transcriptional regulator [Streptomyces sp. RB17]MQY34717.1 HTH-type transcriptional activator RamA [Streptomyces sp. RB17]